MAITGKLQNSDSDIDNTINEIMENIIDKKIKHPTITVKWENMITDTHNMIDNIDLSAQTNLIDRQVPVSNKKNITNIIKRFKQIEPKLKKDDGIGMVYSCVSVPEDVSDTLQGTTVVTNIDLHIMHYNNGDYIYHLDSYNYKKQNTDDILYELVFMSANYNKEGIEIIVMIDYTNNNFIIINAIEGIPVIESNTCIIGSSHGSEYGCLIEDNDVNNQTPKMLIELVENMCNSMMNN